MQFCTLWIAPRGRWFHRIVTAAAVLTAALTCGPTAADEALRTMTITVPANRSDGYVLKGPFKAGTKFAIRYVSGKWAVWPGGMEEISPDNPSQICCQTVIAERSKPDGPISILALVPGGTSNLAKGYQLDNDTGEVLIRINGKNGYFAKNTGSVEYRLTIDPEEQ